VFSTAGHWLYSHRRWLDPEDPNDLLALDRNYSALCVRFPAFARCLRSHFLRCLSVNCQAVIHHSKFESKDGASSEVCNVVVHHHSDAILLPLSPFSGGTSLTTTCHGMPDTARKGNGIHAEESSLSQPNSAEPWLALPRPPLQWSMPTIHGSIPLAAAQDPTASAATPLQPLPCRPPPPPLPVRWIGFSHAVNGQPSISPDPGIHTGRRRPAMLGGPA
jgi:hypothetical protein